MTSPRKSSEEEARLDALRRRLYRADATEADRQRYEAERIATIEPEPLAAAEEQPAARRPRRGAVVLAAVVAGGLGLTLGVVVAQPATERAKPAPAKVLQQSISDAQRFTIDTAGVRGPTSVATAILGTALIGQRFEGHGPAVVPVDLLPGSFDGGRAMVVLTAAQPAPTAWRALRVVTRSDFSSFPVVMAHGTADPGTIVATPSTFVYPGAPPARIAVEAPDDVRWTLLVAATSQIAAELH